MRLSNLIARAENATVAAYRTAKPHAANAARATQCYTSKALRAAAKKIEPRSQRIA